MQLENQIRDILFKLNKCDLASKEFILKNFGNEVIGSESFTYFVLFADILQIEQSSKGCLKATEGLKNILETVFEMIDLGEKEQDKILDYLNEFEKGLNFSPTRNEYNFRILKENSIILFYLTDTKKKILNKENGELRWKRLCVAGYRAIRIGIDFKSNDDKETLYERAERSEIAVKYVLEYLPKESFIWANRLKINFYEILSAIRNAHQKERKKKNQDEERVSPITLNNYRRVANYLLRDKKYRWRRYYNRRNIQSKNVNLELNNKFQDDLDYENNDPLKGLFDKTVTNLQEVEITEGGIAEEFDFPEYTPKLRNSPKGSANFSFGIRPIGIDPIWSKGHLTAEVLGTLLASLEQNVLKNSHQIYNHFVLLFVQFQLYFGFHPEILINLRTESFDENSVLKLDKNKLIIKPKRENSEEVFSSPFNDVRKNLHLESEKSEMV